MGKGLEKYLKRSDGWKIYKKIVHIINLRKHWLKPLQNILMHTLE